MGQENNILQTQYGLRFIDFEYSGMCFQATDIANYFVECMIDYLAKQYPYYSVNMSNFPTEREQRLFCAIYLSEYLECKFMPTDPEVDALLETVSKFTLASHLLWALWSVVRAPQGQTFTEFDFLHYSKARWEMYKRAKSDLLTKRRKLTNEDASPKSDGQPPRYQKTPVILGAGIGLGSFLVALVAVRFLKIG